MQWLETTTELLGYVNQDGEGFVRNNTSFSQPENTSFVPFIGCNDGWIDNEKLPGLYSGISFRLRKGDFAICKQPDEPGGHYAKWNKTVTERQRKHDSSPWGI